ncbi:ubiquitin carboxyl-terminal hydrolase 47-like [Engraulis encrasicolus]|uniref:ubiquitin carboxyl-terminal hydrolase 47-like n=1 Tax=Engraulis encrasicolus TaxID=184585 RepID=UPI002FD7552A
MPKSKLREADSRVPLSEPIPKKWKLSADISSGAQNGLRNQGATCYLNSGLQILFMTKEFREGVLNSKRLKDSSNDNNLLNRLCQLFENLYDGHKPSGVSTVNITKALSIANVYEQQDAVEWFEKILNEVPEETSQVYKGILRKTLKCLTKLVEHADCEEDSTFFSIPLSIDADTCDVYNVDDGLKDFFQTTRSDEDDRMYCDDCDEKTDTEIRFNIQKYPTVLILHLKRFYFDYFQMGYQKNSCPMDIPLELDFFKDCPYDLYGIINHSGQYRGGHYDAYIKPPENNHWYCFDDSRVTEITDNNFLKGSRTAYMIVYRKRSSQIYLYEEINSLENTAEDALKTKAEDELQRRESFPPSHEEHHTPKNCTEYTDVNEFSIASGGISEQMLILAHQDSSQAVAEEELKIREPLPSSHQQQNIMKTCTEGITATVNEVWEGERSLNKS